MLYLVITDGPSYFGKLEEAKAFSDANNGRIFKLRPGEDSVYDEMIFA